MTCRATSKDGTPCRTTNNLSADSLCFWHDPARANLAAAARAKGQKAAARSVLMQVPDEPLPPIVSLEDCDVVASWIVRHLADGSLDPRVAREMTAAIAQKRHVLGSIREMERRLKEYKARLAALEKADTRG